MFSPHIPLWGNASLPHLRTVPDPQVWARHGVRTLRDVMPGGRLLPFGGLRHKFGLPHWMCFRYLQLRHALRAQFPDPIKVKPHSIERLLTSRIIDITLSSNDLRLTCAGSFGASRAFSAWQRDLPALTEEDWSKGLQQFISLMIAAKDRSV